MCKSKKDILFIHHDPKIVGSTVSLRNMIAAIDREKFNLRVLLSADGHSRKFFEDLSIPVDVVPIKAFGTAPGCHWYKLGFYKNFLAFLPNKQLRNYLYLTMPDIIHINDKALLSAGLTAKKLGFPIVWQIRSSYFPSYSKFQASLSRSVIRKCASRLIVISEDEIDGFEDLKNVQVIYNSVDIDQALREQEKRNVIRKEFGLSDDEIAVATITSTINEVRGTWDFINAAGIVHRQKPDLKVKFFIVARIPVKSGLSKGLIKLNSKSKTHPLDQANALINKNNLDGLLTLTGYRKDPLAVMAAMDIVVVCNRHGVLGRMPFEAMSVGSPVVATAGHSKKSKVAVDEETALIVEPANPASIASGIIRLIKDPHLRQKLIQNGEIAVNRYFNPDTNARLIENIYEGISESLC